MRPIIAIDPGASGGIATRDTWGQIELMPMPATDGDVVDAIRSFTASNPGASAVLEKVGGFIKGNPTPGSTMFRFGRGVGVIEGALLTLAVPYLVVMPRRWQERLHLGARGQQPKNAWDNKLKAEAQRRYPGLKITLKTCDALLILDWAREQEGAVK